MYKLSRLTTALTQRNLKWMYTNGKDTNKKDQTLHKFRSNATHIELVLSLDVDFSPLDLEVYGS